jgi:hypothetical protein
LSLKIKKKHQKLSPKLKKANQKLSSKREKAAVEFPKAGGDGTLSYPPPVAPPLDTEFE